MTHVVLCWTHQKAIFTTCRSLSLLMNYDFILNRINLTADSLYPVIEIDINVYASCIISLVRLFKDKTMKSPTVYCYQAYFLFSLFFVCNDQHGNQPK